MSVDEIAKAAGAATGDNGILAGSPRRMRIDSGALRPSLHRRDGQSATPARSGGVDPLAELARLIEQDETFGAVARRGQEAPASSGGDRDDGPFQHVSPGDAGAPLVPTFLCDEPTGDSHEPQEDGEDDGSDYAKGLPSQRRRLPAVAALIGLALAGCASAMAYWAWSDGRVRSDDARVIGASISPAKTVAPPAGENGRAEERPPVEPDERSVTAGAVPTTGEEKPADAVPAPPPAVPPTGVLAAPDPAKAAGSTPAAAPPGSPADTAQNQPTDGKEPAPSETAPVATGPRYVVQLSSQRSETAAQTTSRMLQSKYPDVFGGRQPFIRRSDLGERGVYYRVQIGPFAIGEANQLCGNLKKSGADCVVQRN
jgi:SPOR domain